MLSRLFAQTALGKQQRKSETEHMQPTVIPDSLFAQTATGKQHQQAKNQQNLSNLLTKSTRIPTHSKHVGQLRNTCVHLSKLSYIFRKPRIKKTQLPSKNSRLNRKKSPKLKRKIRAASSPIKGHANQQRWHLGINSWTTRKLHQQRPTPSGPSGHSFFIFLFSFFSFMLVSAMSG